MNRWLSTTSFIAGLVSGAGAVLVVVIAVPGLFPPRARTAAPAVASRPSPEEPRRQAPSRDLRHADESLAIAALKNVLSAQALFQSMAVADEDRDGVGEFGSFAEMSGALGVRDGSVLNPPILASAFRTVTRGRVEQGGYRFRIYLPQTGGQAVGEREKGGVGARELDADDAERAWCCYAWPVEGDGRAFFINQKGTILSTDEGAYSGDRAPPPYAAFRSAFGLTVATAIDEPESRGADHCVWRTVE